MDRPRPPENLLTEHADFVRALAGALLGDPTAADDIAQETWLRVAASPPRQHTNLRAWLGKIARNVALTMRTSQQRRRQREHAAAKPDRRPSAAEVAERIELQKLLWEAVGALDEPYRTVVVLRYFDGLPPAQIAAQLGVPVKTVKTRLHRALEALRARLDASHGGGRDGWSALLLPLMLPPKAALAGAVTAFAMKKAIALCLLLALAGVFTVWRTSRPHAEVPRHEPVAHAAPLVHPSETVHPPPATALKESDAVPALTFAGRVVTDDGQGVSGAAVRLIYWQPLAADGAGDSMDHVYRRDRERHEAPATLTDAAGYFRIDRPYGSRSLLRADAPGLAAEVSGPHEPGKFVLISLAAEPRLRVRVVDPDHLPVTGAEVRLVSARGARDVLAAERTDADGWAAIAAAPGPPAYLEVDPREPDLGLVDSVPESTGGTIEVVVPRVVTQDWQIVDAETGAPLSDGYVLIFASGNGRAWWDEPLRRRFDADASGIVRCPAQEGHYGRLATAPGYEVLPVDRQVMPLRRAMRIDGQLLDSADKPVAEAAVCVATTDSFLWDLYACRPLVQAWTDADGRFSFDVAVMARFHRGPAPDSGFRSVLALAGDRGFAVEDSIPAVPGSRRSLVLRLSKPATIDLEMVRPSGEPVPGQWLQIVREVPRAPAWPAGVPGDGVDLESLRRPGLSRTDEKGRYVASLLPPGRYRIRAENTVLDIDLAAGEERHVRMVKGAGLTITGTVLSAAGSPMAGVNVGSARTVVQTDEQGRFRFDDVEPGDHVVSVHPPRWPNFLVVRDVKPGGEVLIRVPEGPARLRLLVEGPAADTEVEYALSTSTGGMQPQTQIWGLTESGETLAFTPGVGLVLVRAKGHGWAWARFEAAPARTTDVRVSLPPAGAIEGMAAVAVGREFRVRAERQEGLPRELPPAEAPLLNLFSRTGVVSPPEVALDSTGRFRLEDLHPGAYRLSLGAMRDGRWEERAGVDVNVESARVAAVTFEDGPAAGG